MVSSSSLWDLLMVIFICLLMHSTPCFFPCLQVHVALKCPICATFLYVKYLFFIATPLTGFLIDLYEIFYSSRLSSVRMGPFSYHLYISTLSPQFLDLCYHIKHVLLYITML